MTPLSESLAEKWRKIPLGAGAVVAGMCADELAEELGALVQRLRMFAERSENADWSDGINRAADELTRLFELEAVVERHMRPVVLAAEAAAIEDEAQNPWKRVIIEELIVDHTLMKEHVNNPKKALGEIIRWNQKVALDPAVSEDACKLQAQARAAAIEESCVIGNEINQALQIIITNAGNWPVAEDRYPELRREGIECCANIEKAVERAAKAVRKLGSLTPAERDALERIRHDGRAEGLQMAVKIIQGAKGIVGKYPDEVRDALERVKAAPVEKETWKASSNYGEDGSTINFHPVTQAKEKP